MERVFGAAELREKILKYALHHDRDGKINMKMVKNMRQVLSRDWSDTTTELLRNLKEPGVMLWLNMDEGKKSFDNFLETFQASQSPLPVKLVMEEEDFQERNHQNLSTFFTRLGQELVEVDMDFPQDGGTMPLTFPPFTLPNLQTITFRFSDNELEMEDGNNQIGLHLLQTLINGSTGLKELNFPFDGLVPSGFGYLYLPPTILRLDMSIELDSKDLQVLLRNKLPKLKQLAIYLPDEVPFEEGLLFQVLEGVRKTLEKLSISDSMGSTGLPVRPSLLRFPLMEKLKEISIYSPRFELGPGSVLGLERCLPKVTCVNLYNQREVSLGKWVEYSKMERVDELIAHLVNDQYDYQHVNYEISPSFEMVTQLHQTFPNLGTIDLVLDIKELTCLKALFRNMVQLKVLFISFKGNKRVLKKSWNLIVASMLGLPEKLVAGLKKGDGVGKAEKLLETGRIAIEGVGEPSSIRNLLELEKLALNFFACPDSPGGLRRAFIADLLFRQAFLKMAKLRWLSLGGPIQPSLEMREEWKRQGHSIR